MLWGESREGFRRLFWSDCVRRADGGERSSTPSGHWDVLVGGALSCVSCWGILLLARFEKEIKM